MAANPEPPSHTAGKTNHRTYLLILFQLLTISLGISSGSIAMALGKRATWWPTGSAISLLALTLSTFLKIEWINIKLWKNFKLIANLFIFWFLYISDPFLDTINEFKAIYCVTFIIILLFSSRFYYKMNYKILFASSLFFVAAASAASYYNQSPFGSHLGLSSTSTR